MTLPTAIVLTSQRSGSTFLMSQLGGHPDIRAFGEILLNQKISDAPDIKGLPKTQKTVKRYLEWKEPGGTDFGGLRKYLLSLDAECEAEKLKLVKIMYNHLSVTRLAAFASLRPPIIHLVRENPLDVFISQQARQSLMVAHSTTSISVPCLEIDTTQLVKSAKTYLRRQKIMQRTLMLWPAPTIRVTYDELRFDNQRTLESVLKFLRLPAEHKLASPLKKIVTGSHEEVIQNWKEVCAAMERAGMAQYLY